MIGGSPLQIKKLPARNGGQCLRFEDIQGEEEETLLTLPLTRNVPQDRKPAGQFQLF